MNYLLLLSLALMGSASAQVEWLTPLRHNFKQAISTTQVSHEFRLKNLSKKPLILIGAQENTKKGECRAEFTQQPILQNQTGSVKMICEFSFVENNGFRDATLPFSFRHATEATTSVNLNLIGTVFNEKYASLKANTCSPTKICPAIVAKRRVCFVNPETYRSQHKYNLENECAGHEMYLVSTDREIRTILDQIKSSCDVLGELTISGHATNDYHDVGIDLRNVKNTFDGYGCMAAEDPRINYIGCNSGNGCQGRLMMYMMARGIFNGKGTIRGLPTIGTALPFTPHVSLDLSSRVMTMENGQDHWKVTGLHAANSDSLYVSCTNECRKVQEKLRKINPNCNSGLASRGMERMIDAIESCSHLAGEAPAESLFSNIKMDPKYRNKKYHSSISTYRSEYDLGSALTITWARIKDCPEDGTGAQAKKPAENTGSVQQ